MDVRRLCVLVFAFVCVGSLAVAYDLLRRSQSAGDLKSGAGDTALAVHFENHACVAFAIGAISNVFAISLGLAREPLVERVMIAIGVTAFAGLLLWCTMS